MYKEYDSECHYCTPPSPKGRVAFGLTAERLTVDDYQYLIDHGWRRSGTWLYLPTNSKCCCPNYTVQFFLIILFIIFQFNIKMRKIVFELILLFINILFLIFFFTNFVTYRQLKNQLINIL